MGSDSTAIHNLLDGISRKAIPDDPDDDVLFAGSRRQDAAPKQAVRLPGMFTLPPIPPLPGAEPSPFAAPPRAPAPARVASGTQPPPVGTPGGPRMPRQSSPMISLPAPFVRQP